MATAQPAPETVTATDRLMIGLAVVNVVLLFAYQSFNWLLPEMIAGGVVAADFVFVLIYAIEFVARLVGAPSKTSFVKSHWYDLVGLVPIADPVIRSFRLIRIWRVWIFSDPERAASGKTFGQLTVQVLLERSMGVVVETIVTPLMIAGITITKPFMTQAKWADMMGRTVEMTQEDIRGLVRLNLQKAPGMKKVLGVQQVDKVMRAAEDAAMHAVVETLRSDEFNRIVQTTTGQVMDEIKNGLRAQGEVPSEALAGAADGSL